MQRKPKPTTTDDTTLSFDLPAFKSKGDVRDYVSGSGKESGISRVGVPEWEIRTHPPIQVVGLEGLGRSQARGALVRSVQPTVPSGLSLCKHHNVA